MRDQNCDNCIPDKAWAVSREKTASLFKHIFNSAFKEGHLLYCCWAVQDQVHSQEPRAGIAAQTCLEDRLTHYPEAEEKKRSKKELSLKIHHHTPYIRNELCTQHQRAAREAPLQCSVWTTQGERKRDPWVETSLFGPSVHLKIGKYWGGMRSYSNMVKINLKESCRHLLQPA